MIEFNQLVKKLGKCKWNFLDDVDEAEEQYSEFRSGDSSNFMTKV